MGLSHPCLGDDGTQFFQETLSLIQGLVFFEISTLKGIIIYKINQAPSFPSSSGTLPYAKFIFVLSKDFMLEIFKTS
jgi:hypothetical protein